MMIISIVAIVAGAHLLGISRGLIADVLHAISAVAAFFIAWNFAPAFSSALFTVAGPAIEEAITLNSYMQSILETILKPAGFVVLFIAVFIAIGLLTHMICGFFNPEEKKKWIPKIIINTIAGLFIAYIITSPIGFYSSVAPKAINIVNYLGGKIDISTEALEKLGFNSKIYKPLTDKLTTVRFEPYSFTIEEGLEAFDSLMEIVPDIEDAEKRQALIAQLEADEQKDIVFGQVVQAVAANVSDPLLRNVMEKSGKLSSKLKTVFVFNEVDQMFITMEITTNIRRFSLLIREADKEVYDIAAQCVDFDYLKLFHLFDGLNAPFFDEWLRQMALLEDRSDESITREATALSYIVTADTKTSHAFDYNKLDPYQVADYIAESEILKNALITLTQGGEIFNPCDLANRYYDSTTARIIVRLREKHGFNDESVLIKSVMAYFGITKA